MRAGEFLFTKIILQIKIYTTFRSRRLSCRLRILDCPPDPLTLLVPDPSIWSVPSGPLFGSSVARQRAIGHIRRSVIPGPCALSQTRRDGSLAGAWLCCLVRVL
jgi:hypothetical protein